MLIKSITKEGNAVPLSPQEALPHAVAIAVSLKNDSEFIYWTADKNIVAPLNVHQLGEGEYEANAVGTVMVGRTKIKGDVSYLPKLHNFAVYFKSSKNEIGIPHVSIVSSSFTPVSSDPSKNVGPIPELAVRDTIVPLNTLGEIVPSSGGKVSSRSHGKK